jgi:hypothetical protein
MLARIIAASGQKMGLELAPYMYKMTVYQKAKCVVKLTLLTSDLKLGQSTKLKQYPVIKPQPQQI